MGSFLNLMPGEMEPGDDWGEEGGIFLRLEPLMNTSIRYNCLVIFQDDTSIPWHTEAPMRVYRSND